MTVKRDGRGRRRDYRKEYDRDHSSEAAKSQRAKRNHDRAEAEKAGRVHKGDGKEVHHPAGHARGKGQVVSRHFNRSTAEKRRR